MSDKVIQRDIKFNKSLKRTMYIESVKNEPYHIPSLEQIAGVCGDKERLNVRITTRYL